MLNYQPAKGEVNNQPSETVPDQAMSIKEIMTRYAKGLPLGGAKTPTWDEEDDLPDLRTLDLEERAELKLLYEAELAEIAQKRKNALENGQPDPAQQELPLPPAP